MNESQDPVAGLFQPDPEQALVQAANRLIAAHPGEQFRLLPDKHIAGQPGADYLLQVDDYDFRLELIPAPGGTRSLDLERLRRAVLLLEANPSTQALLYVWTTPALDSAPLSLARIQYLLLKPDRIPSLVAQARPFEAVIADLIARQIKLWDLHADLTLRPPGRSVDLTALFADQVGQAITIELSRGYRNQERSQAAQDYPYYQEKELLMATLREALQGTQTDQLIERLLEGTP